MTYFFSVRGWLELSWPDADVEGVDESREEHEAKAQRVRALLTTDLSPKKLLDPEVPARERYRAGWGFPQHDLDGSEYVFFGADVTDADLVLEQIREVLRIDPFADGYFSVEGEDGEQYRQWLIKSGTIYSRRYLFPDFDAKGTPLGYLPLSQAPS
ncbi:MAG TPA: hypothetical protein VMX14_09050 [Anaerolineae bacterium]|nr:hypothetical protein [Anaerolineae bacterium]